MAGKKRKKDTVLPGTAPQGSSPGSSPGSGPVSGLLRTWEGGVDSPGGERADRWFAERVGILSRSQIKARGARFFIGRKEIKASRPLSSGESLRVEWTEEPSTDLVPEDIPLRLLHSDRHVFVVDKPAGMVTHPGHGNRRGTLANAALFLDAALKSSTAAAPDADGAESPARGGIVHRLDKDTSGVIIVARDAGTQEFLSAQFRERRTRKEYVAITCGVPPSRDGKIEDELARDPRDRKRFASRPRGTGGKAAITDWRVLAEWTDGACGRRYALVALYPHTGRTHQLRVHMAGLGCPILGDPIYGRKDQGFPEAGLHLHARRLRILLPDSAGPVVFRSPLPERFRRTLRALDERFGRT